MENQEMKTLIEEIRSENEVERSYLKKQLNMMKGLMFAMTGIFIMMLVTVAVLVPKISNTLQNANTAIEQISQTAREADELFASVSSLVEESSEGVTLAIDAMNSIDFEGLNQSIEDLGNVVAPLSSFFSRFK